MVEIQAVREDLRAWYARHGRHDLPWRQTRDPYAIWISEVMLQQTTVQTVRGRYYEPFLERFPDLSTLATAPRENVLKAWEGLGYYRRAHHLHEAAQLAAPHLPKNVEALEALPGIGKNTAHAIAAFAWGAPVPVMEANVRRVLHRLHALESAAPAQLWEKAEELLHPAHPYEHNQAMMDLGAMICLPKAPQCAACPLSPACKGKDRAEAYPAPSARKKTPIRQKNIIICHAGDFVCLTPRRSRFLSGLYGFVEIAAEETDFMLEGEKLRLCDARQLGEIRQVYSHFTLEAAVYAMDLSELVAAGRIDRGGSGWQRIGQVATLALSAADHKAWALMRENAIASTGSHYESVSD